MTVKIEKVYVVIEHYKNESYKWKKAAMQNFKTEKEAENCIEKIEKDARNIPDSTYWTIQIQYGQVLNFKTTEIQVGYPH